MRMILIAVAFVFGGLCMAEEAAAAVDAGWQHNIGEAATMALQIIAGVVAILVPLILRKLLGLIGLKSNAEIEALTNTLIKKGINVAEQWAAKQAQYPQGKEKMQMAVGFVLSMAKQYNLPAIAEAKLIDLIEAQLERDAAQVA